MKETFSNAFADLPVLVTGHTGFKGSWLSVWLLELGAHVVGYSLPEPPTVPNNFEICDLGGRLVDVRGDVRDLERLQDTLATHRPVVIFHLAAQPLVLRSYREPKETFDTNVGGTINLLEAVRALDFVQAVVCITTDKVYENQEWVWGYRENDRLGGHDPYSSSKAMAELAITSYRRSFFAGGQPAVASTRAGNVIGGGDFADFRLVPDTMKALMARRPVGVRNPDYVRPWQHVLEPLAGYLWLAAQLLREGAQYAGAWNFAPREAQAVSAREVVEQAIALWPGGEWVHRPGPEPPKETSVLRLNWDKAANRLGWQPLYTWHEALAETVAWFRSYQRLQQGDSLETMYAKTVAQIRAYAERAQRRRLPWVG